MAAAALGEQRTAVYLAAGLGHAHVLRFLLAAAGGDPDRDDGEGTPYSNACSEHHHDCVRVLHALGAAPDHDKSGECTCPPDIAR